MSKQHTVDMVKYLGGAEKGKKGSSGLRDGFMRMFECACIVPQIT